MQLAGRVFTFMPDPNEDLFGWTCAQYVRRLGHFFSGRGVPQEVSSDLVTKTLNCASQIVNTKGELRTYGDYVQLLFDVARKVHQEYLRKQAGSKRRGLPRLGPVDRRPKVIVGSEIPYKPGSGDANEANEIVYELAKTGEDYLQLRADLIVVDSELIRFLARHPQAMYELHPRKFEELVAEILHDLGYEVELTSRGADGGIDIIAFEHSSVGESLMVVDCKRYSCKRKVGVGLVRALYGVGEHMRATRAMLATTSFFTEPAVEFQATVRYRLSLRDYNDLFAWLNSYGTRARRHYASDVALYAEERAANKVVRTDG